MPYADALGDGGSAAWDAIWRGRALVLSNNGIERKPELFIDVINNMVAALESRKELIIERESASGSRLQSQPRLRGWELIDIATSMFMFNRKEVPINTKTGGDWYRIASENPDVVVLFCNGLGEPIKAAEDEKVCRTWTPVPEGKDYLTASVPCLKQLAEVHGESILSPKLTPNLYWHRPSGERLFEDCSYDGVSRCNRLQDLKRKNYTGPGTLDTHGAVIFGRMEPTKIRQCKRIEKPIQEGEAEIASQEYVTSRPPEVESPRRDSLFGNNTTSQCCNGPVDSREHVADILKPYTNGALTIPIHSKYSRPEHMMHASVGPRPQYDGKDFNAQSISYESQAPLPSEFNIVRRRPRFKDLRSDLQSV